MTIHVTHQGRRRMYYWAGTFICVVGVLLLLAIPFKSVVREKLSMPTFIGGYCAVFATLLSFFQILEHLTCFSNPECQTKVVRILFMVPLYAMISWICLLAPGAAEYLNVLRDAYESYAIYAFFQLMIALMGGVDTLYRALMLEEWPPVPHIFPLCWLEPMKVSPTFVRNCRLAIFQFMVVKPLAAIVIIILKMKDELGGLLDVRKGHFWTAVICNFSITTAFTALVYFYIGLKEFMEGTDALLKFICIKAVIFLSFWQGILVHLLAAMDWLPDFGYWTKEEVPQGLQDLLICIEMMFVAFAHRYCFGSDVYDPANIASTEDSQSNLQSPGGFSGPPPARTIPPVRYSVRENLKYTLRNEDIFNDIKDIMRNQ